MNTPDEPLAAAPDPTPAPLPNPPPQGEGTGGLRRWAGRWPALAALAAFLLLAGAVLVVSALINRDGRPLYPNLPTFTPLAATFEGEPAVLTFTELNADPDAYRDRRIQVAGNLARVAPPGCVPYSGPGVRWSLVAEELQLNAAGFENVLQLVAEGTPMTVTGIWRLYRGPVGCGKEPEDGNVWFLAVDQIVEPNPLLGENGVALTVIPGEPPGTLPPLDLTVPTLEATATLTETLEPGFPGLPPVTVTVPLPTIGATSTVTLAATPTLGTPDLTGTPTPTGTPTSTGSPGPSPTAGPSPTPSVTTEGGETVTPGIPTATLSGTGYSTPSY